MTRHTHHYPAPDFACELDALGVLPRAKPTPKPAQGPVAVARKGEEPDF